MVPTRFREPPSPAFKSWARSIPYIGGMARIIDPIEELAIKADLEKKRGFRFGKKDGNNEWTTRQWVKVDGFLGCGLLVGIFIRRPENGELAYKGSVQFGATKPDYHLLTAITPARWWQFFFQPHTFGQIAWWKFWCILLAVFFGSAAATYTMETAWWLLLTLAPIALMTWQTARNFTRSTV